MSSDASDGSSCKKWVLLDYDNNYDAPIIRCNKCSKIIFPHFVHKTNDYVDGFNFCDYVCEMCHKDGYVTYFCYVCRHIQGLSEDG